MLQSQREEAEGKLQMLLSLRKNSLTSLFKEVRVFKVSAAQRSLILPKLRCTTNGKLHCKIAKLRCTKVALSCCFLQEPLNAPFLNAKLMGCFTRDFQEGKRPTKVCKRPLRRGNAPLRLMVCFRARRHGGKRPLSMGKMWSVCHLARALPASIWGHRSQVLVFASTWDTQKGCDNDIFRAAFPSIWVFFL